MNGRWLDCGQELFSIGSGDAMSIVDRAHRQNVRGGVRRDGAQRAGQVEVVVEEQEEDDGGGDESRGGDGSRCSES